MKEKKEDQPKYLPVAERTVLLMSSPVLAFCLLSPLPSIYIILGHLSWRSYWLKDASCLRSCISSCSFFFSSCSVCEEHLFLHCSAALPRYTWSLQQSFFFFFSLCPPILLNGHPVKYCLHRLTAIEVLEKKPDPCTYYNKQNQNVKTQVKYITMLPCQILLISPG